MEYFYDLGRGVMYKDQALQAHLENASVIKNQSLVIGEWNLNNADNIKQIGNYRFRPNTTETFKDPYPVFDSVDAAKAYTDATYSDIVVDGGLASDDTPITFKSYKEKQNLLFSLEDCFGKIRPRSGINKFTYGLSKIPFLDKDLALRPRYYFADKEDKFKYWTSYRSENGVDYGISGNDYYINDAAPFIVYKDKVATNKIVIKMQTHVGTVDKSSTGYSDPFYGSSNKATPTNWKIQKLNASNAWVDMIGFGDMPTEINPDGYVELTYGLIIPNQYKDIFVHAGEYSSIASLPTISTNGYAYLIKSDSSDRGVYKIWLDIIGGYADAFDAKYGWYAGSENIGPQTNFVTNLGNPDSFTNPENVLETLYREIDYIYGLRLVVKQMNKKGCTFDLIELSPRLCADLSDITQSFDTTKNASDIGATGLPVGKLLASTGSLSIFDDQQAFSKNNPNSLVASLPGKNIQFKFYDVIYDVPDQNGILYTYYLPIKTLYSEEFPQVSVSDRTVSFRLRDLYFYFESMTANPVLLVDKPLTYILATIFDAIGFSNYKFLKTSTETDKPIPYFFIGPDQTVAEVLNSLAVSTQTAMFFDEANNFVLMSKNYILPTEDERGTDVVISGTNNVMAISSSDTNIYNAGKIIYTSRYIQKTYGSINQASLLDSDKTWIHKPVLLWEVSPSDSLKPINEEVSKSSGYTLSAIPLNYTLPAVVPTVVNGQITNNVMDFGEGIFWISRYNGYFYANAEIIRYDAVEFDVGGIGKVWVSSVQEYKDYFSKLTFKGKIMPTGRVRIYSEPFRNSDGSIKNGAVSKHGRMQFGTQIAEHTAGVSGTWTDSNYLRGCYMDSSLIFNNSTAKVEPGAAGINSEKSKYATTTRNGIIKNFFSTQNIPESSINSMQVSTGAKGVVQSSALVINGPTFSTSEKPTDSLSYVYKPLNNRFVHFGTRMRIVGKLENSSTTTQMGVGSSTFYDLNGSSYEKVINNPDGTTSVQVVKTPAGIIGGASGGIAVLLNPETNNGYYFEIAALTNNNVNNYSGNVPINNVFFYKIGKQQSGSAASDKAGAEVLWAGLAPILVDDGKFTGQGRLAGQSNPTVYDLSVEYEDTGSSRAFYLYINGKFVTRVEDKNPLPNNNINNTALFVRGSSRVMFENIYALSSNYSQNTSSIVSAPAINAALSDRLSIKVTDSFKKYALSGMISSTFLSTVGASASPEYNLYFEEFGTIMREAAYFNVRYDKAYPALYAKMSPTFNNVKGYTVSNFVPGPYGAEFMIFNNTDTFLNLDETSGNYLRIQGVTFTQQSQNELTVDEYFAKNSDFSSYKFDSKVISQANKDFNDIKNSRITYGKKEFTLDAPYIQSQDAANDLMGWVIKKIMKPRMAVALDMISMPTIQLGDIVKVSYEANGIDEVSQSRFVVYSIEYKKSTSGPSMKIYLSEVA